MAERLLNNGLPLRISFTLARWSQTVQWLVWAMKINFFCLSDFSIQFMLTLHKRKPAYFYIRRLAYFTFDCRLISAWSFRYITISDWWWDSVFIYERDAGYFLKSVVSRPRRKTPIGRTHHGTPRISSSAKIITAEMVTKDVPNQKRSLPTVANCRRSKFQRHGLGWSHPTLSDGNGIQRQSVCGNQCHPEEDSPTTLLKKARVKGP